MIDTTEVAESIAELEAKPLTLQNCGKLATFYTILDHNDKARKKANFDGSTAIAEYSTAAPSAEGELADIFPTLTEYREQPTATNFKSLCNEVAEFLQALYTSTRNADERRQFNEMINRLHR